MARPRIFVSSTYYDLKHIRSSLELFIESLGFEPVLSEKGDIPYNPDQPLDESCYKEAAAADLFVLVVGGRYGSEISGTDAKARKKFYELYESITKKEFEAAHDENIPVFILIESGVFSEYQTYLKNRTNETIVYAHVDSVNVFRFIEGILSKQKNNPVYQFERSAQIEAWLREQWAGLFRDLLRSRSQQRQLLALTGQVAELKSTNETLKNYLEVVLNQVSPETSEKVIRDEEIRLVEAKRLDELNNNTWYSHLVHFCDFPEDEARKSIMQPNNKEELLKILSDITKNMSIMGVRGKEEPESALFQFEGAREDFNQARQIVGLAPIDFTGLRKPRRKKADIPVEGG